MHPFLANLLAGSLFFHAMLGCCWHHAHACARCDDRQVAGQHSGCCCHHQRTMDQGQKPDRPCKCKLECQGVCVYVPVQKTQLNPPRLAIPFNDVPILSAQAHDLSTCLRGWRFARNPAESGPPLRLHLLHQILLI